MENLKRDLTYSLRRLYKKPSFTIVALAAIGLGIGANTAIFSVVNAVLLHSLPYKNADRLVMVFETKPQRGITHARVSLVDFNEWRNRAQVFDDMAAIMSASFQVDDGTSTEEVLGSQASGNLFLLLGVQSAIGRSLLPEDDQPGSEPVVLLSDEYWRTHFDSDPNVLTKTMIINERVYSIIGVMPSNFRETFESFPSHAQMWTPFSVSSAEMNQRGLGALFVIARLKLKTTLQNAQADMTSIAEQLAHEYPNSNAAVAAAVYPLHEEVVGRTRISLMILMIAAGLVLLIACANVANLFLVSGLNRHKEIAVRLALGATKWKIIRQLLTESLVLSSAGGMLGLLLSFWGVETIARLMPSDVPRVNEITVNGDALAFTVAMSVIAATLFGLIPALYTSRVDLTASLKESGPRASYRSRGGHMRNSLIIFQVSLTLVLLIGAGLMINSFIRLHLVDPGFNTENLLTMNVTLRRSRTEIETQWSAFFEQLIENARNVPGVHDAAAVAPLPLGDSVYKKAVTIEERLPSSPEEKLTVYSTTVSAEYFRVMGIPLLKGRDFGLSDTYQSPPAVLINESLARWVWPDEDPVGKRLLAPGDPARQRVLTIVGVVADSRSQLTEAPRSQLYEYYLQMPQPSMHLVARTDGNPSSTAVAIRHLIHVLNRSQPVGETATMKEIYSKSTVQKRFHAVLLGILGVVAMILAMVGVYGVISYSTALRTHEIGIRMALGAKHGDILRLVGRQGVTLTIAGVTGGLVGAFALTRLISSFLYGVSATDPMTFGTVSSVLIACALLASYIPARRAAKVDPMIALRSE